MKLKNVMLLAVFSLLPLTGCSANSSNGTDLLDKIVSSKTLNVATEATYAPFEYFDSATGEIVGFDVDIVSLVANKIESTYNIDLNVKWTSQDFDGLVGSIQTGKADLVAAAMSVTEKRAQQVSFSDSYFTTSTTVIVKTGTSVSTMDELKKLKCGAQLGTVQADYITKDTEGWNVSSNMVVGSVADLSLALEAGQIDALVIEVPVAKTVLAKYSDMTEITSIDFDDSSSFALATSKDNSTKFVELINSVLSDAKSSGKIDTMYNEALDKATGTSSSN